MKQAIIVFVIGCLISFSATAADNRFAIAVSKFAECALSSGKWDGEGSLGTSFEIKMIPCRKIAYSTFPDFPTRTNALIGDRFERLLTIIELEALQQYREAK